MFNFSFPILIRNILAWFLRDESMQAWLEVLLFPAQELYDKFLSFKDDRLFFAKVTGQVESLENMLNKIFYNDGDLREIYIEDGDRREPFYLFNKIENKAKYLYNKHENEPVYLFNKDDVPEYDFIVFVPSNLIFDEDYMKGLIKENKAAGFSFTIKRY